VRTCCVMGLLVLVALFMVGCWPVGPQPPLAEFTYTPSAVHAGEEVLFDATPSRAAHGAIVAYAWEFGDGATGEGSSPAHIYAADGSYVVTLTVTDDGGRQGQIQATLSVLPEEDPPPPGGPRASFTAQPRQGPAPLEVSFDASASTGAIVAYRWEFGDGGVGVGVAIAHTYTDPGAYTVVLTVEDGGGLTHTAARSITVQESAGGPVEAAFTVAPNPAAVGQTVTFDASASTGPIAAYNWEFGDGATAAGKTVQHTYAASGQYVARLTVRDPYGTTDVAEETVWIAPVFPPPPG